MISEDTVTLAANMLGDAIQRDCPSLTAQERFAVLIRGLVAMLNAGCFARDSRLFFPADARGTA